MLIVRAGAVLSNRGRRCGTPGPLPGGLLHLPHLHLLLSHHELLQRHLLFHELLVDEDITAGHPPFGRTGVIQRAVGAIHDPGPCIAPALCLLDGRNGQQQNAEHAKEYESRVHE